MVVSGIGRVLG